MLKHLGPVTYVGGLIALVFALTACSSSGLATREIDFASDPRRGEAVGTICFPSGIRDFYSIGRGALVLKRSQSQSYLVQTSFCPAAHHAEVIALTGRNNCLNRGDRLFIDDTPFPDRKDLADQTNACVIFNIHEWNERVQEKEQMDEDESDNLASRLNPPVIG
ncbi:MAG: hypothetical protein Hens3KO_09110 [Henriciella sp.]